MGADRDTEIKKAYADKRAKATEMKALKALKIDKNKVATADKNYGVLKTVTKEADVAHSAIEHVIHTNQDKLDALNASTAKRASNFGKKTMASLRAKRAVRGNA